MKAFWLAAALALTIHPAAAEELPFYRAVMVNVIDAATIVVRYARPGEMGQEGVVKISMLSEGTPPKPGCDPAINTNDGTIQALRATLKAENSFTIEKIEWDDKRRPAKAVVRLKDGGSMLDILLKRGLYCPPGG